MPSKKAAQRPSSSSFVAVRTLALGLAGVLSGCLFNGFGSGSDSDSEVLRECSGGASSGEVTDATRITDEYAESLHEMVACGGLNVRLCTGVVSGIINAIIESQTDATPDGWAFEAGGTYRTEGEGVVMTTQFFVAADFEFASSGDLITENVFDTRNYLVDAVVNIDLATGRTTLGYSETGPLVELLGFGAEPDNPISLSLGDLNTIEARMGALEFESDVQVDDVREFGTIQYHTETPRLAASALLSGVGMTYDLIEVDGSRADLSQNLIVDEWTIEFVDEGGGALNGSSKYRVEGGSFDYFGVAEFDNSTFADTTLSCTAP